RRQRPRRKDQARRRGALHHGLLGRRGASPGQTACMLRNVYELTHVARSGENVGDDWTFYVHTGAGLVCLEGGVHADSRPQVIGVRTRPAPRAEVEFDRELWWASATERDRSASEHGASLFMPVWLPLEP